MMNYDILNCHRKKFYGCGSTSHNLCRYGIDKVTLEILV